MPIADHEERKKYHRIWRAKRREKYLNGKRCALCGSTQNLEIHHRNPLEKESHVIWSWREDRLLKELEKCEILCCSCHQNHHAGLMRKPLMHGTKNAYSEKGCRCQICKDAQAARQRKWRELKVLSAGNQA